MTHAEEKDHLHRYLALGQTQEEGSVMKKVPVENACGQRAIDSNPDVCSGSWATSHAHRKTNATTHSDQVQRALLTAPRLVTTDELMTSGPLRWNENGSECV